MPYVKKQRFEDLLDFEKRFYFLLNACRALATELPATMEVDSTWIIEDLRRAGTEATDFDLCLDDCKGMYFCRLQKGHEGRHVEGGLAWD